MDVKTSVIKRTAQQLGVNKEQVKLDMVVPDIHAMCQFVAIDTCKAVQVKDLQKQYTVEQAIEMFESKSYSCW